MSQSRESSIVGLGGSADAPDICVLFGALRSGTTMLRLMIDGHPRLICPGETDFLTDHLILGSDGGWKYDLDALANDRIFQNSRAELPPASEAGAAFRSMAADLKGRDLGRLVLVMHRGLGRLLDIAPNIPILHLVRDPRDVARSAIGMGWAGHVYYGMDIWLEAEEEWERMAPRLVGCQTLELRYEALIQNAEGVLGHVCSFLGERYHPGMLSYSDSSTYDRPDPAFAEQWRTKLNASELGLAESRLGDLLARRGYKFSGHRPIVPGRVERFGLWFQNKKSIWQFRIKKFGLLDPLIMALARRLSLTQLSMAAQRRMDKTIRENLK